MNRFSRVITVTFSASALALAIAGCQPQGATPSAEVAAPAEDMTASAEASSTAKSSQLMGAAEISDLVVGYTLKGVYADSKWVQYFSPDETMKTVGPGGTFSGTYYANDQEEFCIDLPEYPWEPKVFCFKLIPLGDGKYQQVLIDGTKMGIYTQILEGEQLDAL